MSTRHPSQFLYTLAFACLLLVPHLQAGSICVEFKADDALLNDGMFGDLDHKDNKWVKLESRGGRGQRIQFSGTWKLSRNAQVDKVQGLTVPIFIKSKTEELVVGIFLYNVKTRGWHPLLSTEPSKAGDAHNPVLRDWREYYNDKTREIKFRISATKPVSRPIDVELDQLSIRPVWHLQQITHEMAKKVSDGNSRVLNKHNLSGKQLMPSKELQRPQLQPGERFRQGDNNIDSVKSKDGE